MLFEGRDKALNIVSYMKEKGLQRAIQVLWRYKLPKLQVSVIARLTKHRPLENKIIIESHNDFDCNGGALYDWLIENGYNNKIKVVWRLYHETPGDLPSNVTCVPIYGPSWRKAWDICTAKWLTADCTVADKVRKDQVSLYMTHGVFGIKNAKGLLDVPPTVDWVLSPSSNMDDVIRWYRGICVGDTRLAHVGYPSLDRLYKGARSAPAQDNRTYRTKTILWMPTFRQGSAYGREDAVGDYPYGIPLITSPGALEELSSILEKADVSLVVKLHPKQDLSRIEAAKVNRITFLTGDSLKASGKDNADLMLEADAMISDYSGAVFEYVVLDRPMAFVLADLEDYRLGLVPDAEKYMPGEKILDIDGLVKFILDISAGLDNGRAEREAFRDWFYNPNSFGACERVVDLLGISSVC